ncbi:MAG TPA: transcription termination/antitermination protein NusA [Candidatus Ornithomonoglobus merdipullorum]|uniref:Transcription termination/antitermination protein NusA n=1 Tax=Candidatus Ornithomonoglobus merdipullorum TaxID=2840895 RepID=A0A9D1MAV7_9FIRM|nr:transcription termination/antitermination protein NusA [Candidatus Ornithomonoglobus merdipullorum]
MNELFKAIKDLCEDRGIEENVIIDALEAALVAAYKKNYYKGKNDSPNVLVSIDRETGEIHVYSQKTVVELVLDPREEISLEDARKISGNYELGDVVNIEETPKDFGRVSAMTAKQVVTQRIREAERGIVYGDRSERSLGMVTGTVILVDPERVYVDVEQYNQAEAILPKKEQPEGEIYEPGDVLRFYVSDVKTDPRTTHLILSRTHPGLVKKLFEKEVPEIAEGIVEIKGIAREGGSRTKIAVYSNDPEVDAQGACIGPKGMRVQNINDELKTEKIDIIKWSEDPAEYITAALSPAKVVSCTVNEEDKSARVVVPEYQLSLAIGKSGQNVRLAAKLTGWKIDISAE